MQRVYPVTKQVLSNTRGIGMSSFTDVSLLGLVLGILIHFRRLHVGAVAQLPLLVLKVGIVSSVRPRGEVIVVPNHVVVWRRHTRQAKIVNLICLVWHSTRYSEALSPDLR